MLEHPADDVEEAGRRRRASQPATGARPRRQLRRSAARSPRTATASTARIERAVGRARRSARCRWRPTSRPARTSPRSRRGRCSHGTVAAGIRRRGRRGEPGGRCSLDFLFFFSGTSFSTEPTTATPASIRPCTRSVKAATRVEPLRATASAAPVRDGDHRRVLADRHRRRVDDDDVVRALAPGS